MREVVKEGVTCTFEDALNGRENTVRVECALRPPAFSPLPPPLPPFSATLSLPPFSGIFSLPPSSSSFLRHPLPSPYSSSSLFLGILIPLTPLLHSRPSLFDTIVIDLNGRRGRGREAAKGRSGQDGEKGEINDGEGNIVRCLCDGGYPSRK